MLVLAAMLVLLVPASQTPAPPAAGLVVAEPAASKTGQPPAEQSDRSAPSASGSEISSPSSSQRQEIVAHSLDGGTASARAEWGLLWATAALVFFTAGLFVASLLQWRAIRRQADLIQAGMADTALAARAAQLSADTAREALLLGEGADLHLETEWEQPHTNAGYLLDLRGAVVTVRLTNYGRTVAKNVVVEVLLGIRGSMVNQRHPTSPPVPIAAGQTRRVGFERLEVVTNQTEVDRIARKEVPLHLWGDLDYEDVFGRNHHVSFAFVWIPHTDTFRVEQYTQTVTQRQRPV